MTLSFGEDPPPHGPYGSPAWSPEDQQAGGADSQRGPGGRSVSLDHLEVVQDGHDVLRHEDVAGVDGHAGHGDEQGVKHCPLPRFQHVEGCH